MKKIFLAFAAFFLTFNIQAKDLTEGKQYQVLELEHSAKPEVSNSEQSQSRITGRNGI